MAASELTVIPCTDLSAAMTFMTESLGFRLDAIFPADEPGVADISGHGLKLRLRMPGAAVPEDDVPWKPEVTVVKHDAAGQWVDGRAGMQYRDLIPGRQGGRFIGSHIRIPEGGPVPDYVHYHRVAFQLIYCAAGWVEVVYEDQGAPFTMRAGDCVLQPPTIRHRVLRCSDHLEVIEVGAPALHFTLVDHELELPSAQVRTGRNYGGQGFTMHVAADATLEPWYGLARRDLGLSEPSRGVVDASVLSIASGVVSEPIPTDDEMCLYVVLRGGVIVERVDVEKVRLGMGDALCLPRGPSHRLVELEADTEVLRVAASVDAVD